MSDPIATTPTALLMLGMHRSGTSLLARVMNLMGVDLGSRLIKGRDDNPLGYWEHEEVVAIHDEILGSFGQTWYTPRSLPSRWWLDPTLEQYRLRLIDIVNNDLARSRLWGLKDPRLCKLLPLWFSVLEDVHVAPCFIVILRHPWEVAKSLEKRNSFPLELGLLLWLQYCLAVERYVVGRPTIRVAYSDLLKDWRSVPLRLSSEMGLQWPRTVDEAGSEIESFVDPSLKHFTETGCGLGAYGRLGDLAGRAFDALDYATRQRNAPSRATIEEFWEELASLVETEAGVTEDLLDLMARHVVNLRTSLDDVRSRSEAEISHQRNLLTYQTDVLAQRADLIEHLNDLVSQYESRIENLEAELAGRTSVLETALMERTQLREELDGMLNSWSWRITGPLRKTRQSLADHGRRHGLLPLDDGGGGH